MPRVDERLAITKGDYCIAIRFHDRPPLSGPR